jgi:O-antigen ligase
MVGLIVMWFVNYYSNHHSIQKRFYIIFALLIILLVALLFLQSSFTTGNPTIDYFLWRTRNIINWTGDAGNVGRVQLWNNALNKWFKKSPWFGIGPSKTGSWGSGSLGVTESGVLKRLCELGVVGVVIYYSMLANIIRKGILNFRQAIKDRRSIYLCLFGIISMILINDITVQTTEQN